MLRRLFIKVRRHMK